MGINHKSHEWEKSKTEVQLSLEKSNQLWYDYVIYSGINNILLSCIDVEWKQFQRLVWSLVPRVERFSSYAI